MTHFNWTQLIPGVGHHYIHVATLILVTSLIVIISLLAKIKLGKGEQRFTPSDKLSIKGVFEVLIEFIVDQVDMVIGEEGRKFVPLFCSIFVFVLMNNLIGLFPGMTPATDNYNTTVALGLFTFITYNYLGFRAHGIGYLKQFLGPMIYLAPLMLPIELVSHFIRPVSLGFRLAGNMTGDHAVLGIFLDLVPFGVPIIFYFLGLFVCFVQAFVFTLLSMVYVSMSISHEH